VLKFCEELKIAKEKYSPVAVMLRNCIWSEVIYSR